MLSFSFCVCLCFHPSPFKQVGEKLQFRHLKPIPTCSCNEVTHWCALSLAFAFTASKQSNAACGAFRCNEDTHWCALSLASASRRTS